MADSISSIAKQIGENPRLFRKNLDKAQVSFAIFR